MSEIVDVQKINIREAEWKSYELIDCSDGERLERWGDFILIRPEPQVIWKTGRENPYWAKADAKYHRSDKGGGFWERYHTLPQHWTIDYNNLTFAVKPMGFKHTGIFPEQAVNWDFAAAKIKESKYQLKILNLFAYTGAATVACLSAGAAVTHVDASKGIVTWAKENVFFNHLNDRPVRWIVDDCMKFVQREQRRGNHYDGIIMDPPSYGRGPNGEVWKLEEQLFDLINACVPLLHEDSKFFLLNSYTTGFSPAVMGYLLEILIKSKLGGNVSSSEIGLHVTQTGMTLPCGITAIWTK